MSVIQTVASGYQNSFAQQIVPQNVEFKIGKSKLEKDIHQLLTKMIGGKSVIGALVFKDGSEGERSLIKIEPVTQEVRDNIKHKELSRFLIDYRFESLPLNALEEISNILDKVERE